MLLTGAQLTSKNHQPEIKKNIELFINNLTTRAKSKCVETYHRAPRLIQLKAWGPAV